MRNIRGLNIGKRSTCRSHKANALVEAVMGIWRGTYEPHICVPGEVEPDIRPYHVGLFLALLRHRSFPEFVHDDRRGKGHGRRRVRGPEDRAEITTSARIHLRVLPEEWPIVGLVVPDGNTKYVGPCHVRLFGREFKEFLCSVGYVPDGPDCLYPDNEENPSFAASCEEIARRADLQMTGTGPTATEAYGVASSSAYGGYMRVPDGIALPENDAPRGLGFTYFIPDWIRNECKIGYSRRPYSRAAQFSTSRCENVVCMAILRGGPYTERMAHMKNHANWMGGEVYNLEGVCGWLLKVGRGHLRELLQRK